jgi:hypothetical protein
VIRSLSSEYSTRAPAGSLPPKPLAYWARSCSHPGAEGSARRVAALSYDKNPNVMVVGVGLMGKQILAEVDDAIVVSSLALYAFHQIAELLMPSGVGRRQGGLECRLIYIGVDQHSHVEQLGDRPALAIIDALTL